MKETQKEIARKQISKKPGRFAFIIGAMKSGTTSLFEILSQHPEICASKVKEPDYFTQDQNEGALSSYLALWNWQQNKHSIALESSVAYTKTPYITGVPQRIHSAGLGECRFIYLLRDPIKRIESQVRHGLFAGWGESLEQGVPEDAINFSRYSMQVEKYFEFFPIDSVMLISLEEFKSNPNAVLSRICLFLEIDINIEFTDVDETRNSGDFFNASPTIARLTQATSSQFIAQKVLPSKLKSWLRQTIVALNSSNTEASNLGRWQLNPDEKNFILAALDEDLKALEKYVTFDMHEHWELMPRNTD